jgi:glyoxylase-like metal-dependent hydrolase (beta-lactamase superfamily II)
MGYSVFVFLVRDQLIDAGFPGARNAVARLLDERRPRGVVVTHQHEDHAGNGPLSTGLLGHDGSPVYRGRRV